MQQVGFGVFAKKAAPGTTTNKRENFGASAEFLQHFMIALADTRGERPLHHLGVGSGGQIGAAKGLMRFQIVDGGGNFQPVRIGFQGGKKIEEPAILVTELMCSSPDAELFHVVAHGGETTRMFDGSMP